MMPRCTSSESVPGVSVIELAKITWKTGCLAVAFTSTTFGLMGKLGFSTIFATSMLDFTTSFASQSQYFNSRTPM